MFSPRSVSTSAEVPQEAMCYLSIHNLPMPVFIDCLTTKDLSGLVLSGRPTGQQMEDAWAGIMSQYSEQIARREVEMALKDLRYLAVKEYRIGVIELLLQLLNSRPNEMLFEQLYTFGYPLPRKTYTAENFAAVLKVFVGHFRLERTQYKLAEEQSTIGKKEQITSQYDWGYFEDAISAICLTMKMPLISLHDLTVGQYCAYVNRYADYLRTLKKHQPQ